MDQIREKGEIENLVRSLSRFSEKVLLVLSGKGDVRADAKKIGPSLICERLWEEMGIGKIIRWLHQSGGNKQSHQLRRRRK
ncbi:MAG: hypothetical protein NTY86_17395 [Deltaproteobacteria bacterium]|nr:hypothetical protein [Deltaproteobacteria bacterium]